MSIRILLSVIVLLVGCNGQGATVNAKDNTGDYRKPGADISLRNKGVLSLTPGQVKDIELLLRTGYTEGTMQVTVVATEGLEIVGSSTEASYSLRGGAQYPLPLQLLAYQPGRYYLNLTATVQLSNGVRLGRAMSFAVVIEDDSEKNSGQVVGEDKTTAPETSDTKAGNGENGVISMPAEEVVY